jgi:NAD(P)-dependent dehydrogenase (short-subunit alcohol dehydrogenase family)
VVVNGRGEDRVKDAVERLRAEVPDADVDGVAADVTTEEGTAALVAKLPQVDVLVNNSSDLASATTGGALRVDGGYVDSILP